ncbi:MAG: AraC family transcriptional regulator, partial [Spirochaetota bacterium]
LPVAKKVLFRESVENRAFHLHCTLLGAGHETLKPGDEYCLDGLKRGSRYFCNFQLCLAGQGQLDWQGQSFTLKTGDVFITQIPHDHRYYLDSYLDSYLEPGATWEFVYLTLTGSELRRIVSRLLELNQGPIFHLSYPSSRLLWSILNAVLVENIEDVFFYSGKVYPLLLSMLSETIERSRSLPLEIQRMQEFIYRNFQHNIGVPDISRQSGLSENYAMRFFKKHTGKTIQRFLEEVRLTQAQNLLQYSIRSIKEISTMVGFRDHNYFIRVFHRQFGITPGKFRRI